MNFNSLNEAVANLDLVAIEVAIEDLGVLAGKMDGGLYVDGFGLILSNGNGGYLTVFQQSSDECSPEELFDELVEVVEWVKRIQE